MIQQEVTKLPVYYGSGKGTSVLWVIWQDVARDKCIVGDTAGRGKGQVHCG